MEATGDGKAAGSPGLRYQWPGTYFQAAFHGTVLYLKTGKGRQGLHVTIDQQTPLALTSEAPGSYRVLGLKEGPHTVRVQVVTESQAGADEFDGFFVPAQSISAPPPGKQRQIEFIGDSYTVGYGNTSPKRTCTQQEIWATTDDSQGIGPLTAEQFGADYQVNAISGRGVVRNYNGFAADTLPVAYPFVLLDHGKRWMDASWKPQVFVIGLGTNDFSTALHEGEPWKTRDQLHASFEQAYMQFVEELLSRDPQAYVLLWATDGAKGEIQAEGRRVMELLNSSGHPRVAFLPVGGLAMTGCDSHPSTADDKVIAGKISAFLEQHPQLWQDQRPPATSTITQP